MKIRNGFVSNSSSSSFVIIMKNNEKLTKEILLETFKVDEESPLYGFAVDLADWIFNNTKEKDIKSLHDNYVGNYNKGVLTEEQMIEELVENGIEKKDILYKIKNKEYLYYSGSADSDAGDPIEEYLCNRGMDVETDEIIIQNDGGY